MCHLITTILYQQHRDSLITRWDVISALRINCAIRESRVSTSPEKREIIRPSGDVSKKLWGARMMPAKRSLCSLYAPRMAPMWTRKLARYNASAEICKFKASFNFGQSRQQFFSISLNHFILQYPCHSFQSNPLSYPLTTMSIATLTPTYP